MDRLIEKLDAASYPMAMYDRDKIVCSAIFGYSNDHNRTVVLPGTEGGARFFKPEDLTGSRSASPSKANRNAAQGLRLGAPASCRHHRQLGPKSRLEAGAPRFRTCARRTLTLPENLPENLPEKLKRVMGAISKAFVPLNRGAVATGRLTGRQISQPK